MRSVLCVVYSHRVAVKCVCKKKVRGRAGPIVWTRPTAPPDMKGPKRGDGGNRTPCLPHAKRTLYQGHFNELRPQHAKMERIYFLLFLVDLGWVVRGAGPMVLSSWENALFHRCNRPGATAGLRLRLLDVVTRCCAVTGAPSFPLDDGAG